MALIAIGVFVLGAMVGSFLTVLAHRLPRDETFVFGRSRCPHCGTQITARDNVPLLSWLVLGGRCRACAAPISPRYPLTELGLATLWTVTYLRLEGEGGGALALGLLLCAVLVAITLTDLELGLIPNRIVLPAALAAVGIAAAADPSSLDTRVLASLAAGGGLLVVALIQPRGMGMGDVKLVAMMGLFLGRAIAPALLIGLIAGGLVGIAMIARQGAEARRRTIPFGPFLAFGGVIALWFGEAIVDWYLEEFFAAD